MQTSDLLGILISLLTIKHIHSSTYKFDNDTPQQCGGSTHLAKNAKVTIQGLGKVPNGYCGLVVYAMQDMGDCKYPAICATVSGADMGACRAKVTFTGKYFTQKSDHSKDLDCNTPMRKFCTQGSVLRVEVIEEMSYAKMTPPQSDYTFNATISRVCMTTQETDDIVDEYRAPDLKGAIHRNYVIGVAVACCLACVFLILLLVMKCYYKSQPYSGLKTEK
ncbi:hypothetical protein FSP39_016917 [Pinctada imbricata]|uniref:Uncharacterized protein n=1 Tax=Pinctada imbricata TaxID=66713 RepID=A0AA89BUX6_PINIB|nr:hypothetical protein FSP39_016917 [Pinctada imbricata]